MHWYNELKRLDYNDAPMFCKITFTIQLLLISVFLKKARSPETLMLTVTSHSLNVSRILQKQEQLFTRSFGSANVQIFSYMLLLFITNNSNYIIYNGYNDDNCF